MKKALKYILILLLCAAIGLGVSAAIYSGVRRVEIENTYIDRYPQATELSKKQGKEILKADYSTRNWEVRFNGTRNAYFWYKGDVYYTFENAPGILLRVQWDSWNTLHLKNSENRSAQTGSKDLCPQKNGYVMQMAI